MRKRPTLNDDLDALAAHQADRKEARAICGRCGHQRHYHVAEGCRACFDEAIPCERFDGWSLDAQCESENVHGHDTEQHRIL